MMKKWAKNWPGSGWMARAERIRNDLYGFPSWRGEQAATLEAVFDGESVLSVMPTGAGKSLCYQLPARLISEGGEAGPRLVLVVSPLIALMKDQVDAARAKGLRAAAIHSAMSREERERVLARVAGQGGQEPLEVLYATPERFRQESFWQALRQGGGVRLLAVDEAHCISTWGHDFRLDYSRLGDRRKELGEPQTLALTATATKETQDDIIRQLGLRPQPIVASLWRPNLAIEVLETGGMDEKVRAFVMLRHMHPGAAIVYFSLVQTLRTFSEEISRLGFGHSIYHGQLGDKLRRRNQDDFISGQSDLMLATPAFGLGVDKANVRLLVHGEMPGAMEAYYQEIGRAGRDGEASKCVALYDADDVTIQSDFVKWSTPDPGFIQGVHNLIARNEMRARQEGFDYLREQMNFYNRRDFRVETSVALLERWGALEGREPRDWKIVAEIPEEFMDQARFTENMRRRQEKLSRMASFFEEPAVEGHCRLARVAASFGENVGDKKCGVCDACLAVS
ncbi:MAG: RecQ family ATP-dependent DNA helicase [Bdellovibrionales bacterium]|nr:RecQ family ATP-dependent DNA helicase [Bdellovibrionales bacterium]